MCYHEMHFQLCYRLGHTPILSHLLKTVAHMDVHTSGTYMFIGGLCDVVFKLIIWFLLAAYLRMGAQQFIVIGL